MWFLPDNGGCPSQIINLAHLEKLDMSYQALTKFPENVSGMGKLSNLNLSNNPVIESVAGDIGKLPLQGNILVINM